MELITPMDVCAVSSAFHKPSVLTADLVGRLTESNAAARALRSHGFRVAAEDPIPDDGGRPILLIDLNGHVLNRLMMECDVVTTVQGIRATGIYRGVRVIVELDAGKGHGH